MVVAVDLHTHWPVFVLGKGAIGPFSCLVALLVLDISGASTSDNSEMYLNTMMFSCKPRKVFLWPKDDNLTHPFPITFSLISCEFSAIPAVLLATFIDSNLSWRYNN